MAAARPVTILALTFALVVPAPSPARSMLRRADGPVEVRSDDGVAWRRAGPGTNLTPGMALRTLAGGRAETALAGGRLLTLEENTALAIPRSSYNDEARVRVVDLAAGTLWASIPRLADGDRFALRTPVALGGVRGTLFRVSVDDRGGSTFGLVTGRIEVASRTSGAPRLTLDPGQEVVVPPSGELSAPRLLNLQAATAAYGALFPGSARPGARASATAAPAKAGGASGPLPQAVREALSDEEKLLAGMQRLSGRLNDVVGDWVALDPAEATEITALADEILSRSQAKGTELRRLASGLPRAAGTTALGRWEDLHEQITAERQKVADLMAIPATDMGQAPAPAASPPPGRTAPRRDLRFIDTAVRDLRAIAATVASARPDTPVPQRLYRRFEATTDRAERQWARLPAPDGEARNRWADYTKERARTLSSFKNRAVAGTQEPDLPSLEDDGSGL